MEIRIEHLLEGAKRASGLTVVIDVFRAFSTAAYVFANGASQIIPVADLDSARKIKAQHPEYILMGERDCRKPEDFDFGNSPTLIEGLDFSGKTIIHTTSAGTQGIANASRADEIIGGSFVNAQAIANYIRSRHPQTVTLLAMGTAGKERADEDDLCALYIEALLDNEKQDFGKIKNYLRGYGSAKKFFDPACSVWAPERDFELCLSLDRFSFVLRLENDHKGQGVLVKQDI
jgi:2-phosphosulfolactate phosphatase